MSKPQLSHSSTFIYTFPFLSSMWHWLLFFPALSNWFVLQSLQRFTKTQKPPRAVACAAIEIPGNLRSTYITRPHLSFPFGHCLPFRPSSHLSDLFFPIVLSSVTLNLSLHAPLSLSYHTLWDTWQPNSTSRTFPQNAPFTSLPYLRPGCPAGHGFSPPSWGEAWHILYKPTGPAAGMSSAFLFLIVTFNQLFYFHIKLLLCWCPSHHFSVFRLRSSVMLKQSHGTPTPPSTLSSPNLMAAISHQHLGPCLPHHPIIRTIWMTLMSIQRIIPSHCLWLLLRFLLKS